MSCSRSHLGLGCIDRTKKKGIIKEIGIISRYRYDICKLEQTSLTIAALPTITAFTSTASGIVTRLRTFGNCLGKISSGTTDILTRA